MTDRLAEALGLVDFECHFRPHATLGPFARALLEDGPAALRAHGDFARFQGAVADLPEGAARVDLDREAPRAWGRESEAPQIEAALRKLGPWRKGPFLLHGVHVDAEWRCAMKWERVRAAAASFVGQHVLDVGAGNGYFSLRLLGAGAASVTAVEPSALYGAQYLALSRCLGPRRPFFVPLPFERLPEETEAFDRALSMGVLYHRRDALDHLRRLRGALRPGGQLVLETLIVEGEDEAHFVPSGRYASMRNVWAIPSVPLLVRWLGECGFTAVRAGLPRRTTEQEQRSTSWSPGPSLRDALAPTNRDETVEGSPAPCRVVVVAERPL